MHKLGLLNRLALEELEPGHRIFHGLDCIRRLGRGDVTGLQSVLRPVLPFEIGDTKPLADADVGFGDEHLIVRNLGHLHRGLFGRRLIEGIAQRQEGGQSAGDDRNQHQH